MNISRAGLLLGGLTSAGLARPGLAEGEATVGPSAGPSLSALSFDAATNTVTFTADEGGTAYWLLNSAASGTYADCDALIAAQGAANDSGSFAVASAGTTNQGMTFDVPDGTYSFHIGMLNAATAPSSVLTEENITFVTAYAPTWMDTQDTGYLTFTTAPTMTDGPAFTFNAHVRPGSMTTTESLVRNTANRVQMQKVLKKVALRLKSASGTTLYDAISANDVFSTGTEANIHVEADLAAGTPYVKVCIDGVEVAMTETTAPTAGDVDWTRTTTGIFADSAGAQIWSGEIAHIWLDITQALACGTTFYNAGPTDLTGVGSPVLWMGDDMTADERAGNTAQGWNDGYNIASGSADLTMTNTYVDVP